MLARCPVCPLRVFYAYRKVADPGDAVIDKQCFSNVDTREPAIATPPLSFFEDNIGSYSHMNQIFRVGRHQGALRVVSPCLHYYESHTSILFHSFLRQDFRMEICLDRYLGG